MEILLNVFIIFANAILGLFILVKNPKSTTSIVFAILALVFSVWTVFNYQSVHATTAEDTLMWIRIILFLSAFKPPLLFLLFHTFPGDKLLLSRKWLVIIFLFPTIAAILALTPLVFSHVEYVNSLPQPVPSFGMPVWALTFFGLLLASFILLIKRYRREKGGIKSQILFMLLGFSFAFCFFIFTNFIMVNVFQNTSLVVIGPLFTIILVGFISYSIIKHGFLDIRLILARAVAYVLLVGIIGGIYTLALFVVGAQLFGISARPLDLIFYCSVTFFVALTFQYFKKTIEKWTDRLLFKGFYDPQELLKSITFIMSTNIVLDDLTNLILHKITTDMRITKGVFILLDKNQSQIEFMIQRGFEQPPQFQFSEIKSFLTSPISVFFDFLEEGNLKDLMRARNISSILPLAVKDNKIGVLLLGEKASGEIYSEQDTDVLEIIAPELSIALQNSKEYEEIKRFNITLREEVDRATRQLRVANTKLEELDKLKDDFVSVASHELRTPMTAIRSYSWMALNRSDIPLSEKMKKYLSRTLISTERLINLVNEMLNISRIESGRVEIKPEVFSIPALVKDVFEEVVVKAHEKNLSLKMDSTQIPNVFADQDKVHQVLLNLIGNSLKFTPENGLIEVKFATNQSVVGIGIKDNGAGISPEDLHRLFKKFGRLDSSYVTAGTSGGTGLGLYVCKSLVQLMGGEIWVQSDGMGKGSTFYFTLPIATKEALAHVEKYQLKPEGKAKVLEPVTL